MLRSWSSRPPFPITPPHLWAQIPYPHASSPISLQETPVRGQGPQNTHAHAHSEQDAGARWPRAPRGAESCPGRSGPSRHLNLPLDPPGPGPNASASSSPLGDQGGRFGRGVASLHSRHCLKENGGLCPPGRPLKGAPRLAPAPSLASQHQPVRKETGKAGK